MGGPGQPRHFDTQANSHHALNQPGPFALWDVLGVWPSAEGRKVHWPQRVLRPQKHLGGSEESGT